MIEARANTTLEGDYYMDRVDMGMKTACVTKCTAHALHFVILERVE